MGGGFFSPHPSPLGDVFPVIGTYTVHHITEPGPSLRPSESSWGGGGEEEEEEGKSRIKEPRKKKKKSR